MISCRYIGGDSSTVGSREFEVVGQKATFSEEQYIEVVVGGAAFITEEQFAKIGFSEDELQRYSPSGHRVDASGSFIEKLGKAQALFVEHRNEVVNSPKRARTAQASGLTNEQSHDQTHKQENKD